MGRRSKDEKMVPEKDEDPPSHAPQGQGQAQGLSAEEAMGSRGEDEMLPEKDEDPPSDVPRGQDQENVIRNPCWSVRHRPPGLRGQDKELSEKREYMGVRQRKDKWVAQIWRGFKTDRLRTHATKEEAALAYDRRAIQHGGSVVKPNFPKPSEEMLERLFKNYPKKSRRRRRPKTSSSALLQEKLRQFVEPLRIMIGTLPVERMQKGWSSIWIELAKVFIRCISRINYLAHLYKKSQWEPVLVTVNYAKKCQHELAAAICSVTEHGLNMLEHKKDLKRARSKKRPANPDLPSTSTAVVCEEQFSDSESSIETREAFREGKNLSSSWLREKLTQVLAPLDMMLSIFVDDLLQKTAGATLKKLVKTFINCICRSHSLAQRFYMAQRESGSLEAINYAGESQHVFAEQLCLVMLQQLGELYPSLQSRSQGNSVNGPPVVMDHSFTQEDTNDVNMKDRPSTSAEVVANIEAVSPHQNAINAGKEDSGDQEKETAEDGDLGIRVASFTPGLVALQEEEHDCQIGAIEALLSLISHSVKKGKQIQK